MTLTVTLDWYRITPQTLVIGTAGSFGTVKIKPQFSSEWDGLVKRASFIGADGTEEAAVLITEETFPVPDEAMKKPGCGKMIIDGSSDGKTLISVVCLLHVLETTAPSEVTPTPTEDYYHQLTGIFAEKADAAEAAKTAAQKSAAAAAQSQEKAAKSEAASVQAAATAETFSASAAQSAASAAQSAANAGAAKTASNQALADLLAMIGDDIAPIVGGKIPLQYIPATATTEIYEVSSAEELTGLAAQRGDLAELIEMLEGERTITKTWQLLGGDASVRANWVTWGTSYAVASGSASVAANAENAAMINNHRLVEMTETAFATAVKDADTYYLVYPEAQA